ncbi:hypothetical protein Q1695_008428 [Nippostrongylus brasiliensis]|nr:hypothetical protein Q1695_008428 [Nippostrongylus brasiliensis]
MQRQYKKVVILLIDALRFDFLVPTDANATRSFFRGHMPNVAQLMKDGAQIGVFLADPPTTTLQRIKALTTGTLPTFIDAGDNFAPSPNINEDNLFFQAKSRNVTVAFMGDDTWTSLYPKVFTRSHPFDSFDINDLNSVDDAVRVLLKDELLSSTPADLIIAHFLGVDHCGHKYGPNNVIMSNTLEKVDKIIMETASKLLPNELLVVMGDHGMTSTGDHGGDSDDETHAGILVYSPGQLLPSLPSELRQIDLVPTLSLLLGLPIPFSNLGVVIEALFPQKLVEQAIALNYEQVRRFANSYAAANPSFEISEIILHDTTVPAEQLAIIRRLQASLRAAWTQFDMTLIRLGLFCFIESLLFAISSQELSAPQAVVRSGCLLLQLSVVFGAATDNPAISLLTAVLPLSVLHSVISIISGLFPLRLPPFPVLFAYFCVGLRSAAFLSNSFIVYEAQVVRFLSQSIILVCFVSKVLSTPPARKKATRHTTILGQFFSRANSWDAGVVALALLILRLEPIFHRCREEEVNCKQYIPLELLSSLSPDALFWRSILATSSLLSLNVVIGRALPQAVPSSLRIARALSWPAHASITFYHMVKLVPQSEEMQPRLQTMGIVLAQMVYGCSMLAIFICVSFNSGPNLGSYLCLSHAACWPLFLLLGDGLQPSMVGFIFVLYACIQLCDAAVLPPIFSLLVPFGFYFTGHSPTLTAIPWQAAFTGLPGNFPIRLLPAALVLTHIAASAIVVTLAVPFHPTTTAQSLYSLVTCSSVASLTSCIAAAILRRHLMVWKIFAPRFIFESFLFIYLLFVVNLTLLICRRKQLL